MMREESDKYLIEGCPCTYVEPCHAGCACRQPLSSSGCRRCASYGSLEQRTAMATILAAMIDKGWKEIV